MDSKRKLFIYDRREVGILILLGVGVSLFAFTLGLHLGKQVNPTAPEHSAEAKAGEPVHGLPANVPSRTEISEEVKNVPGATEDTLDQTLRDEITQSGLKLATPKPLKLPEQQKRAAIEKVAQSAKEEAAKDSEIHAAATEPPKESPKQSPKEPKKVLVKSPSTRSEYSLQTGSYPKEEEAAEALRLLVRNGLSGDIREVEIPGKGKWFRVLIGKFKNTLDAERSGKSLKEEKKIDAFIVVKAIAN